MSDWIANVIEEFRRVESQTQTDLDYEEEYEIAEKKKFVKKEMFRELLKLGVPVNPDKIEVDEYFCAETWIDGIEFNLYLSLDSETPILKLRERNWKMFSKPIYNRHDLAKALLGNVKGTNTKHGFLI